MVELGSNRQRRCPGNRAATRATISSTVRRGALTSAARDQRSASTGAALRRTRSDAALVVGARRMQAPARRTKRASDSDRPNGCITLRSARPRRRRSAPAVSSPDEVVGSLAQMRQVDRALSVDTGQAAPNRAVQPADDCQPPHVVGSSLPSDSERTASATAVPSTATMVRRPLRRTVSSWATGQPDSTTARTTAAARRSASAGWLTGTSGVEERRGEFGDTGDAAQLGEDRQEVGPDAHQLGEAAQWVLCLLERLRTRPPS